MTPAEYATAKRDAIRTSFNPPPVTAPTPVAVTDQTLEQFAATQPKRASEMTQAEYLLAKSTFARGRR